MAQEHTGVFIVHIKIWPPLASAKWSRGAASPPLCLRNDRILPLEVKYPVFGGPICNFRMILGLLCPLKCGPRLSDGLLCGEDDSSVVK